MSIAGGPVASMPPTFHKDFSDTDADLTVISSDNIAFRLYSKFLEFNKAHGLQLAVAAAGADTDLTVEEPASILEILFAFLYPRRYPSVVDLDFQTLLQMAEAAEEYKIFNAVSVCEFPLRAQVASHSSQLLSFGLKYDNPGLADLAAIHHAIPDSNSSG